MLVVTDNFHHKPSEDIAAHSDVAKKPTAEPSEDTVALMDATFYRDFTPKFCREIKTNLYYSIGYDLHRSRPYIQWKGGTYVFQLSYAQRSWELSIDNTYHQKLNTKRVHQDICTNGRGCVFTKLPVEITLIRKDLDSNSDEKQLLVDQIEHHRSVYRHIIDNEIRDLRCLV